MSAWWPGPRALFGAPLRGHAPVHYIYVDEAGTSQHEKASVVVGVMVHADTQWMLAKEAVAEVLSAVPAQFRNGFVFHAKTIWGHRKYREGWSREGRAALLHAMMLLPRRLGLPLALGVHRRGTDWSDTAWGEMGLSNFHVDHVMAFAMCMGRADMYLRKHTPEHEIATVVAENADAIRDYLRGAIEVMRPYEVVPAYVIGVRPTKAEQESGAILQDGTQKVTRIIDTVHFVKKDDAPLLQIADACAYGFRRYFEEQTFGREYVRTILGQDLIDEDWAGPRIRSVLS